MFELKFEAGVRAIAHEWTFDGEKISAPEKLAVIKAVVEKHGPILAEHKFLCGARAPHHVVFDNYEEFVVYLMEQGRAGDKVSVWNL